MKKISDEEWAGIQAAMSGKRQKKANDEVEAKRADLNKQLAAARKAKNEDKITEIIRERPNGEKLIFGYKRCSGDSSDKSGMGLEEQEKIGLAYAGLLLAEHADLHWAGFVEDRVVSAYEVRFFARPNGKLFREMLRPGDHLIFPNIDRFTRHALDGLSALDYFSAQKISLHFAQERIDVDTAMGRLIFSIFASIAEHWARITSERMKACNAHRRRKGLPGGGPPPIGFKAVGPKYNKAWAFDMTERSVMGEIYRIRTTIGMKYTWDKISDMITKVIAEKNGDNEKIGWDRSNRTWSPKRCKRAYESEIKIQEIARQAALRGHEGVDAAFMASHLLGYWHFDPLPEESASNEEPDLSANHSGQ